MPLLHTHCFSQTLNIQISFDVILPHPRALDPAKPFAFPEKRFPVLYLLHGLSDDHTIWQRRTSIERYVESLELAVVMPAVNRSFYTDMAHGARYWAFISEELPALVRHMFPLSAAREDNFVAGLSMGGYGAFKLGLSLPERFAAAASMSGALDIAAILGGDRDEAWKREMQAIFGDCAAVAGSPHDLFRLARDLASSGKPQPKLYQCCGTEDFLYADNQRFLSHARQLGLEIAYSEAPAAHDWGYWDQEIQKIIAWLPGLHQNAKGVK